MKRPKGTYWDYNGDGRFKKDKLSKADKSFWNSWESRRLFQYELDQFEAELFEIEKETKRKSSLTRK